MSFQIRLFAVVAALTGLSFLGTSIDAMPTQAAKAQKAQTGTKINGHIVNIKGKDQVMVRTHDNRDVWLFINPQTTFLRNNQAVVFTDLREGVPVQVMYDTTGNQFFAGSFMLTPTEFVEGEIVRVVEPDHQLVVRGADGKEVIFVTEEQTYYTFDNRHARLADFRPGINVRVHFDVRNQKHVAHSVWTLPTKSK